MKVFISWSGELSKQLGQALRDWLRPTLQSIDPYFSPTDIEKGQKWHNEISNKLEEIDFCIIAMTREALSSQWIIFEAGAISKRIDKSRICSICFDIVPSDIQGPLAPFQGMKWDKEEIRSLIKQMNAATGEERLADAELQEIFDDRWPKLEARVDTIMNNFVPAKKPEELRNEKQLIEEVLLLVRAMQNSSEQLRAFAELASRYGLYIPPNFTIPGNLAIPNELAIANYRFGMANALRNYEAPTGKTPLPLAASTHEPPKSIMDGLADINRQVGALAELFREGPPVGPAKSERSDS